MLAKTAKPSSNSSSISLRPRLHPNQTTPPLDLQIRKSSLDRSRKDSHQLKIGRILLTPDKTTETQLLYRQTTSKRKLRAFKQNEYPRPGLYRTPSGAVLMGQHTGMRGRRSKRVENEFKELDRDEFLNFFNQKPLDHSDTYKKAKQELKKKVILGLKLNASNEYSKNSQHKQHKKLIITLKQQSVLSMSQSRVTAIYESLKRSKISNSRDKGWQMDEETPWSMKESLPFESINIIPPSGSDIFKSPSSLLSISVRQSASLLHVPSTTRKRKVQRSSFHDQSQSFQSWNDDESKFIFDPQFILDNTTPEIKATDHSSLDKETKQICAQYMSSLFRQIQYFLLGKKQQKSELATYIQNETELDQSLILVSAHIPLTTVSINSSIPQENSLSAQSSIWKDIQMSRSTNDGSSSFGFSKIKERCKENQLPPVQQIEQEQQQVMIGTNHEFNEYSEDIASSIPHINILQSKVGVKQDYRGLTSANKIHIAEMEITTSELGCSMQSYRWNKDED